MIVEQGWTETQPVQFCQKKFYFNKLDQRLIKMINRTMDVVFTRSGWNSFIITLRQKPRGVSRSRRRTSSLCLRETPLGFWLRVNVNEFHPNPEKTTSSVLSVILINLWVRPFLNLLKWNGSISVKCSNSFFFYSFKMLCLFVCVSVSVYSISVKTAEPIGLKLCVGPHMNPAGSFICMLKITKYWFLLNFKNARKNFFVIVLYCTKRRCFQIEPQ